jgi:chromosomal replication initiation ATPase DnaA
MQITVQQIQQIVSNVTKISIEDITSQTRKANIVQSRHLSMHFSRWYTNLPMKKIAKLHGKDNHATIIHADEVISYGIRRDAKLKATYTEIESQIKNF